MAKKKVAKKKAAKAKKGAANPGMSDAAIKAKTGKTWAQWAKTLNGLGAAKLDHTALAKLIKTKFKLPGWWAQGVTVGYERMTGKRAVHQTTKGFVANISKMYAGGVQGVFDVLDHAKTRRALLGGEVKITTRHIWKTLRFPWTDGVGRVVIAFYPKAKTKTQVTVQHEKLKTAADVKKMKAFWQGVLAAVEKHAGL